MEKFKDLKQSFNPHSPDCKLSMTEKAQYRTKAWERTISAYDSQVGGGHYKDMKIQPIEFIVANELGYREGNAVKYICRHKNKNGKQDIEKAIHYLQMILEDYSE